jgi:hypothetical protein
MDTARIPSTWPWPSELDAMTAAPDYHALLFESDDVRVLEAHVPPGETVPVHTHCWPGVLYIVSVSDFVRRDPEGRILFDSRGTEQAPAGSAVWGHALPPHSLENVGPTEMRNITVELKQVEPPG